MTADSSRVLKMARYAPIGAREMNYAKALNGW